MRSTSGYALEIITIEQAEHFPTLKTVAKAISFPLSPEDQQLIAAMKEKLDKLGGVGLAAPQVNQSKRIIAVYIPKEAGLLRDNVIIYPMHILINPSYQPVEKTTLIEDFEACYSVSSKAGKVPRYQQILLEYCDEQGQKHRSMESGFYARVLQHEIDHLNGLLIIDRLSPDCIQGSVEEMMALRRSELTPEQQILFDVIMEKKRRTPIEK